MLEWLEWLKNYLNDSGMTGMEATKIGADRMSQEWQNDIGMIEWHRNDNIMTEWARNDGMT